MARRELARREEATAHFAFICVPTPGHIDPLAALARELVRRGHRATFVHHSDVRSIVEARGLDFHAIENPMFPSGELAKVLLATSEVKGLLGLQFLIQQFARGSAMFCEELPRILEAKGVDALVSDWIEPATGLVARHMHLPYVSIAAALPLNWEVGVPSPFVGWAYGPTRWHRARNIAAQYVAMKAQRPIRDVIETYATRWQLGTDWRVEYFASNFAQIAQLPASLDYPRRNLPKCFHYCGPLRGPVETPPPEAQPNGARRRAFASLGSLMGHRVEVFERIADAAADAGFDLTIAHGGRLPAADVARLSRRANVHDFISYQRVLRSTDVAIMHGGMNGVLDALAQGVPLVVLPLAYEQSAIASRVRYAGAGIVCRPRASRRRLATAMRKAAAEGSPFAGVAARIGDDIRASGGTSRAADIIEQVAATRRPCITPAPGTVR